MNVHRSTHARALARHARRSAFVAGAGLTFALALAPAALADDPEYPPDDNDNGNGKEVTEVTPVAETDSTFGGTVPQTGIGGGLPDTGAEVATVAALGLGTLALGTATLVVARRRQQDV